MCGVVTHLVFFEKRIVKPWTLRQSWGLLKPCTKDIHWSMYSRDAPYVVLFLGEAVDYPYAAFNTFLNSI
jgi:hypothetical protein